MVWACTFLHMCMSALLPARVLLLSGVTNDPNPRSNVLILFYVTSLRFSYATEIRNSGWVYARETSCVLVIPSASTSLAAVYVNPIQRPWIAVH